MAFTRRFLKGIGLTDEQIESAMEEHVSVTDALKAQIDSLKEDTKELNDLSKEVEGLRQFKADAEKADWETKYKDEHQAFEDFKSETASKETTAKIKDQYRAMLKEANIDEKRFDAILRVTDFSNMKLTQEGKLANAEKLAEGIKQDWSGFVVTQRTEGQQVDTPPANNGAMHGSNAEYIRNRMAQRHANLYGGKKEE